MIAKLRRSDLEKPERAKIESELVEGKFTFGDVLQAYPPGVRTCRPTGARYLKPVAPACYEQRADALRKSSRRGRYGRLLVGVAT